MNNRVRTPRMNGQTSLPFHELLACISDAYGKLMDENDALRREMNTPRPEADRIADSLQSLGPGAQFAIAHDDRHAWRPCVVSSCVRGPTSPVASIIASGDAVEHITEQPLCELLKDMKASLSSELAQVGGALKQYQERVENRQLTTHVPQAHQLVTTHVPHVHQLSVPSPVDSVGTAYNSREVEDEEVQDEEDEVAKVRSGRSSIKSVTSWRETAEMSEFRRKSAALKQASAVWSSEGDAESDAWVCMETLRSIVRSNVFECFFCSVIVTNTVYIGFETDYLARNLHHKPPVWSHVVQFCFLFLFVIELVMRMLADGKSFWCSRSNWAWNWLDAFVVASASFEAVVTIVQYVAEAAIEDSVHNVSHIRIVRIIRVARLLRIFRISRIMRFLSALRTLVYSIIGTLTSLFWAIFLLVLIIYTFGVVFTQAAGDHRSDLRKEGSALSAEEEDLGTYYGSLPTSMFTLFMSIAAGISWTEVVNPLFGINWLWAGLFTVFIAFTYFAVLNIVTANFCQSAIDSAAFDQELIMQRQANAKKAYAKLLQRLFSAIDTNGSGAMSLAEMEQHFNDKEVQAYLQSLELEPQDAWSLFKLLDADQDSSIEMDEFVTGCMRLRGEAKKIDLAELIFQTQLSSQQISDFMQYVDEQFERLHRGQPCAEKASGECDLEM